MTLSRTVRLLALATLAVAGLAACDTRQAARPSLAPSGSTLDRMEALTLKANRCWFKSKDRAFASYSLAPELSSFSGRPRFLLVPKGRPEAKPLLVVEGSPGSRGVATYGPVMSTALGARVDADIRRWSAGGDGCDA